MRPKSPMLLNGYGIDQTQSPDYKFFLSWNACIGGIDSLPDWFSVCSVLILISDILVICGLVLVK